MFSICAAFAAFAAGVATLGTLIVVGLVFVARKIVGA